MAVKYTIIFHFKTLNIYLGVRDFKGIKVGRGAKLLRTSSFAGVYLTSGSESLSGLPDFS
jgi:hypothetical protein